MPEYTGNLWIQETWLNKDKEAMIGESDVYETFTEDKGRLYRSLVKEYGRCTGKVYVDTKEGPKAIGWVFVKRQEYSDCNETYLKETWVSVHKGPPKKTVRYDYA